jgi:DNA-binding MarR family transcriptional regulator
VSGKRPGSGRDDVEDGLDEQVRALLVVLPKIVGRAKRRDPPAGLAGFSLAPRHLSLFAVLLDGALGVSELADTLDLAPTTVSLMVGELSRQGLLERHEDPLDRRRKIVHIAGAHRATIDAWLGDSARSWRGALGPLAPAERRLVVEVLERFERELRH